MSHLRERRQLSKAYIQDQANAWASTTLKKELYRLLAVIDKVDGRPTALWRHIETHYSPYSRKTVWTRVTKFVDWLIEEKKVDWSYNPYRRWAKKNAKVFKHVYEKKPSRCSYSEAEKLIKSLPREDVKAKAFQLLRGGLRFRESLSIQEGKCVGKGGKIRPVCVEKLDKEVSYGTLYRHLKKVGLTPHQLRKIRATQLAEKGYSTADLCKIFGWNQFETASSYIAPTEDVSLMKELMKEYKP